MIFNNDDYEDSFKIDTVETIETQAVEILSLRNEVYELNNALSIMRDFLVKNNLLEQCLGGPLLSKPISSLTKEELIARNKEGTVRSVKHVHNKDAVAMPNYEEEAKLVKEMAEERNSIDNPALKRMFDLVKEIKDAKTVEELRAIEARLK
jgi:hypothetical protein